MGTLNGGRESLIYDVRAVFCIGGWSRSPFGGLEALPFFSFLSFPFFSFFTNEFDTVCADEEVGLALLQGS